MDSLKLKQFDSIQKIWKQDIHKKKATYPKTIKDKDGFYTKKFLRYNQNLIKDKKTFYYLGDDKIYNPETERFTKLVFDKRAKNKLKLNKASQAKKPVWNTSFKKIETKPISNNYENTEIKDIIKNINEYNKRKTYNEKDQYIPYETTIDLKKITFQRFIDLVKRKAPNSNLVSTTITNSSKWITLSQDNLQRIQEYNELTFQEDGSDMEFLMNAIKGNGIIKIKTTEKTKYIKPAGNFFKYFNNTKIDLSRYDIYRNESEMNCKENCLYVALRNLNLPTPKLNEYKTIVKKGVVAVSSLNKLCEKLDICISLTKITNGKNIFKTYGNKDKDNYNIGLIDEHYFINEKTEYTSFSITNYEEIKNILEFNKIHKSIMNKDNTKKLYKRTNDRYISSFDLIKILLKTDNLLTLIPYEVMVKTPYFKVELKNDELIKPTDKHFKKNEMITSKRLDYYKVFYDFETITEDENIPYLMCCITQDGKKRSYLGEEAGKDFINFLKKLGKKKILLIAHNHKYDLSFIWKWLMCLQILPKGNRLMGGSARIYTSKTEFIEIALQCSNNLIQKSLKDFGKMFQIDVEKELMAYSLYTKDNVEERYIKKSIINSNYELEGKLEQFYENCSKWECIENDYVDIVEYSRRYCEIDCEVLQKGYETFRKWVSLIKMPNGKPCELDIMNYCSSPSFVNDYFIKCGVYSESYAIGGVVRAFIQKCVSGGKVMTRNNEKNIVKEAVADYDAVSSYPSAMDEMAGILKGKPKLLKKNECNLKFLNTIDGYFVKVFCKEDPKINRPFPLLSQFDENGIRNYTNNTKNKVYYLDKYALEDAMEFQGLEFDILCGYYYNEGRNMILKQTINLLFNERLKKKKEKNQIQEVYKLFMNSAYGKSLLKPIDCDVNIVYEKNWNKYLTKNYNFIREFTKISDNQYLVKRTKSICDDFNNCYFGIEVLSMAKRGMNRVMCMADDLDINIYYTDTDSIHITYDKVPLLEKNYNKKYNTEIKGKQLGQFHIDFDLKDDITKEEAIESTIRSVKSIYLGKKCYIDKLEGIGTKTGKKVESYHIRMKGTPNQSIHYTYKKLELENPFELYNKLYEGNKVNFDLLCGGTRFALKYNGFTPYSLGYYNKDENGKKTKCKFNLEDYNAKTQFSEFTRTLKF